MDKRNQMSEIRETKMLEPQGFDSRGAEPRGLADGLRRWLWRLQSEALTALTVQMTPRSNIAL